MIFCLDKGVHFKQGSASRFINGNPTNVDFATVKYDAAGNRVWEKIYSFSENSYDYAEALAVDATGNVYVAGSIYNIASSKLLFVIVKYDANGNEVKAVSYDNAYNYGKSYYNGSQILAVDAAGNVYMKGNSCQPSSGCVSVFIKYDTSGNQLWDTRYTDYSYYYGQALAVDATGNAYVTSLGNDYASSTIIKYDSNGKQVWITSLPYYGYYGQTLALDTAGNVYVTGGSTAKYDTDGKLVWVTPYYYDYYALFFGEYLALDAAGNVYVVGPGYIDDASNSLGYVIVKYIQ